MSIRKKKRLSKIGITTKMHLGESNTHYAVVIYYSKMSTIIIDTNMRKKLLHKTFDDLKGETTILYE